MRMKRLLSAIVLVGFVAKTSHGFETFDGPNARRPVQILGAIIWGDPPTRVDADSATEAERSTYAVRPASFLQEPLSEEAAAGGALLFRPPLSVEGQPSGQRHSPATLELAPEVREGGSPFHGMPLAVRGNRHR